MLRMDGLTSDFGLDMWVDTNHYLGQLVNPKGLPALLLDLPNFLAKNRSCRICHKVGPKDFERTELCSESGNPE